MFVSELSFIAAHWKVMASVTTMIGLIIAEANVPPSTMTVEASSDTATHKLTFYVNGVRYKLLAIQE